MSARRRVRGGRAQTPPHAARVRLLYRILYRKQARGQAEPPDSNKTAHLRAGAGGPAKAGADSSRFLGVWTLVKVTDYRGKAYDLSRIQGTVSLTTQSMDDE